LKFVHYSFFLFCALLLIIEVKTGWNENGPLLIDLHKVFYYWSFRSRKASVMIVHYL